MISLIAGIFVIVTEKVSDPKLRPGLTTPGFDMTATMAEVFSYGTVNVAIIWKLSQLTYCSRAEIIYHVLTNLAVVIGGGGGGG